MSNIVINDLEHNIELDRKSLIELKGGKGAPVAKIKRKAAVSNLYYILPLANGRSSFRRGPYNGFISGFYGNSSATSSSTSSAIG